MHQTHESTHDATLFHEYSEAAKPKMPALPCLRLTKAIYDSGETRVINVDQVTDLSPDHSLLSPSLGASFIRVNANQELTCSANASNHFFYVIEGRGYTKTDDGEIAWAKGDVFICPMSQYFYHKANQDAVVYWVNDAPLLNYLKACPDKKSFTPRRFAHERIQQALNQSLAMKNATSKNRNGVLLAIPESQETKTLTPVLWVLFNQIAPGHVQKPHRHNSVAFDYVISSPAKGVYSLISQAIDEQGQLINPRRMDWESGCFFVTPPGYWHSHHNESDSPALIMPVQDAGLHTYLRSLDIQFSR